MSFSGCLRSKALMGDTWVQVVTPDGMRKRDQPHKVIYMLHGTTGNSANWVHNTLLPLYANEHNVVFVMPEVGNTWYRNIPDRGDFFTYIVDELPDIIGGIFNVSDKREDVAIMGSSMGAYGALKCALTRPDQYWLCAGFSTACVHLKQYLSELRQQKPVAMENPTMRAVFGPDLECTDDDELLSLAERASANPVKPRIHMTIGRQDFLYEFNQQFSAEMKALPLDFTYDVWDGGHDWRFWDQSLKLTLEKFYPRR